MIAGPAAPAFAQTDDSQPVDTAIRVPADATVESLYTNFLHYARMGRFTLADAYAKKLLSHPELEPVGLLAIADKDRKSLQTLLILIKNSSIGESAARVLELIQRGEHEKRKSLKRILTNIERLGGDPQQEYFAIRQLAESGEYAVPPIVHALLDPERLSLRPRMIQALPKIGKAAVNPLVIALQVRDNDVRLHLIQALGEIGYPQAIPYLRKLIAEETMPEETRSACTQAVARIEELAGRSFPGSADDRFVKLAEQYYYEDDAVRADPRLDDANVWYWDADSQELKRVAVPQRIFGPVMAMRCCDEALRLRNDHAEAIALWLAANIRRENRLGLNVESGDPDEAGQRDDTRPDVFPRALYFTQTAGPRYAHLVLRRAVRDQDSPVALGAISALRTTAGEASLIGTEDYKQPLVQALEFPDLVVRIRAALALGAALPKSSFAGAARVVPVLASALAQTGNDEIAVVDPDEANLNRVAAVLRHDDRNVIGETNVFRALDRARTEFAALTGLFVSTDVADPGLVEGLQRLRSEFIQAKTPVVILAKPGESGFAERLVRNDPYVEIVDAAGSPADINHAFERVRARTGQAPFDEKLALSMALKAAGTLRRIAADGRTPFDVGDAEPALIAAAARPIERLQIVAASVLALIPTPTAQRAVAHLALDEGNTTSLRVAAFKSLAESARNFGRLLEEPQVVELVGIAHGDPDLVIRTAASQALGAVNLKTNQASAIIRSYYGG